MITWSSLLRKILTKKFNVNDLDVSDVILGIQFFKISNRLILSSSHYVEKVLKKFFKDDYRTNITPIDIYI